MTDPAVTKAYAYLKGYDGTELALPVNDYHIEEALEVVARAKDEQFKDILKQTRNIYGMDQRAINVLNHIESELEAKK